MVRERNDWYSKYFKYSNRRYLEISQRFIFVKKYQNTSIDSKKLRFFFQFHKNVINIFFFFSYFFS